ncbi:MAG: response regulator [Anaerolineae bacterium]|nr:response regulator [Anaerolineae bacterium]
MAHILMIEDDVNFIRLLGKVLGELGHTIASAETAMQGLQLTEGDVAFDLVLLDMDLPDLDGKVVATTLRARPSMKDVPIIAVTAQNDAVTRRLVKAFGCNGFIPKPIDTRAFPEQIAAFLSEDE